MSIVIGIENRLSTAFEHNVKLRGAQGVAFPTQVAGGSNSQYVQYACNDCIINPGDVSKVIIIVIVIIIIIIPMVIYDDNYEWLDIVLVIVIVIAFLSHNPLSLFTH